MDRPPEQDGIARLLASLGCLAIVLAPIAGFLYGCSAN